ncbi:molybdenum cofactor biosynthesis protein [Terracidiphilus gabretensis]|uniref:molybdenum cofactor biosynthesis protein n=1 Tax=Terracidiphilus gabretensis TaxID=1577687 RepID=UPI00071BBD5F|nr:molybdenum cofactor biosynthesis protein MoaE [Terracidiphilus gabretensis]
MQIKVQAFGVLKVRLGEGATSVELPEGATVADLLAQMENSTESMRGIAVSVNAEYARASDVLREGDEVGLLPPVSGGRGPEEPAAGPTAAELDENGVVALAWSAVRGRAPVVSVGLQREPIAAEGLIRQAKDAEDGAVVVFDGIVRNNSRGRRTLYLEYEAYEEMALAKLDGLGHEARERFGVRFVGMVHRLGRLEIGETSVLIVVSSAHRAQAYEASRWLIDTLKTTVPVWKKEIFEDGTVWADGEPFPEGVGIA